MVVRMRVGIREAKWRRYQNENRRPSGRQSNRDMPRGRIEDVGVGIGAAIMEDLGITLDAAA